MSRGTCSGVAETGGNEGFERGEMARIQGPQNISAARYFQPEIQMVPIIEIGFHFVLRGAVKTADVNDIFSF